jgi:uncharacterized membrane protein (DUF441 family)
MVSLEVNNMFSQPMLFLLILLGIGVLAKNQSLIIAVSCLIIIKVIGLDSKILPTVGSKGINWGVTIITIAVLVPIATGDIGFKQLLEAVKSAYAWIALGAGIAVALIAKNGLTLLAEDPHITTALVFGPLIGAGIAYIAMQIVKLFSS